MNGSHFTADITGCNVTSLFTDQSLLSALCREKTIESGLTIVGEHWVSFPDVDGPGGVTGAILLAESHLAIHTWPELGGVTIDVYVCNYSQDNSLRAKKLLDSIVAAFNASGSCVVNYNRIERGDLGSSSIVEVLDSSTSLVTSGELLKSVQSEHQLIEVYSTSNGASLVIDGAMMTTEADEHNYHETMVQAGCSMHRHERVLVVGGGDGGLVKHLLKTAAKEIVLVELDSMVIDVAKEFLGPIHQNSFDDPRVTVLVGDVFDLVSSMDSFDLVFLDLTDPCDGNCSLYSVSGWKKLVNNAGAMVLHLGSPVYQLDRVKTLLKSVYDEFTYVTPLSVNIPTYGGQWAFAVVGRALSKNQDPALCYSLMALPSPTFMTKERLVHSIDAMKLDGF